MDIYQYYFNSREKETSISISVSLSPYYFSGNDNRKMRESVKKREIKEK